MKNILGINLEQLLREAVKESVDDVVGSDNEKIKQKQAAASMKNFHASKKSKSNPNKDEELETSKAVDEDEDSSLIKTKKSSSETPDVDLPAIIDLIGSIRSGRSLKDKSVLKDFKVYFKRLNGNERLALYAFLTGISKIMLAPESEEVDNVAKPSSDPYSVKMDREIEKTKKVKKSSSADKSDDTPIMIGESQDKTRVLQKLKSYR